MTKLLLLLPALAVSACATSHEDLKSPCPPAEYASTSGPCELTPINVANTATPKQKA